MNLQYSSKGWQQPGGCRDNRSCLWCTGAFWYVICPSTQHWHQGSDFVLLQQEVYKVHTMFTKCPSALLTKFYWRVSGCFKAGLVTVAINVISPNLLQSFDLASGLMVRKWLNLNLKTILDEQLLQISCYPDFLGKDKAPRWAAVCRTLQHCKLHQRGGAASEVQTLCSQANVHNNESQMLLPSLQLHTALYQVTAYLELAWELRHHLFNEARQNHCNRACIELERTLKDHLAQPA